MSDRIEKRTRVTGPGGHEADDRGAILRVKDVPMFEDLLWDFRVIEQEEAASRDANGSTIGEELEEQAFKVRGAGVYDLAQGSAAILGFGFGVKRNLPELIECSAIAEDYAELANERLKSG